MDDVIELENVVTDSGFRIVRLMSNMVLDASALRSYDAPANTKATIKKEGGAYKLWATWPICGAMYINGEGWPVPKQFVVWYLELEPSIKQAMYKASKKYEDLFFEQAEYAFIRKLPHGVENGVEVGNLMLFEADWMVHKCVAVGFNYQ